MQSLACRTRRKRLEENVLLENQLEASNNTNILSAQEIELLKIEISRTRDELKILNDNFQTVQSDLSKLTFEKQETENQLKVSIDQNHLAARFTLAAESEKYLSAKNQEKVSLEIQVSMATIESLKGKNLEQESLEASNSKTDTLQSYINSLTETESLISNCEIEDFAEKTQIRLLENDALLFQISQKTQALQSLKLQDSKNCDYAICDEEFKVESLPLKFLEWHESTVQKLEMEFSKQISDQKDSLTTYSRLLKEKEHQVYALQTEKGILMQEICTLKSQIQEFQVSILENSKISILKLKNLESELTNAKSQIESQNQELQNSTLKFQESESLLKLELHKILKLNSEMEKSISMSVLNQNVLLDQIKSLKNQVDLDNSSIQNFRETIGQLERENQNLHSIKKEQESLINSLSVSQVTESDNIQETQKTIQGNNYMILHLERKNYDYRKRILKSSLSVKKPSIINQSQSLYEKSLVAKASQRKVPLMLISLITL